MNPWSTMYGLLAKCSTSKGIQNNEKWVNKDITWYIFLLIMSKICRKWPDIIYHLRNYEKIGSLLDQKYGNSKTMHQAFQMLYFRQIASSLRLLKIIIHMICLVWIMWNTYGALFLTSRDAYFQIFP